jgi:CysZ protein
MFTAAFSALSDMFSTPLRRVLLKSIGLALLLIVFIAIALQRLFSWLAQSGIDWAEASAGVMPHGVWTAIAWIVSILATLGVVTGAIFLMPAIAAFVGSFFVDDVADHVERARYPAHTPGRAVPLRLAVFEGLKTALLALVVYVFALPFVIFAGIGIVILFLANAWLLSREYFELAAMRFHPVVEAKALRRQHAGYLFAAGFIIAAFVSIPIVNLATPLFAMTFMVHLHKQIAGGRRELIEPQRR